jgi:hypothetical protein
MSGGEMFNRLTTSARRAIFFARYEAHQAGAPSIGTEHMLLGILRVDPNLAERIPEDLDPLRKHLLASATDWLGAPGVDVPMSAAAKQVMTFAEQEASILGHNHVTTDHLFLGVLRQTDSVAGRTLARYGIDLEGFRQDLSQRKRVETADTPDRGTLHSLIDDLPAALLSPAQLMLEQLKFFPPPVLPFPREPGEVRGMAATVVRDPDARVRDGHRSSSRTEDGARIFETSHIFRGIEITVTQRMQLSDDGQVLSYSASIRGPKEQGYNMNFDFDLSA